MTPPNDPRRKCPLCMGRDARSDLLHDGLLRVLALDDARLYKVAHGVIALASGQDAEAG